MRVLAGALCVVAPLLTACGGTAAGPGTANPARAGAGNPTAVDTTTTTTSRNAPLRLAEPPPPETTDADPCEGTFRERVRRRARERRGLEPSRGSCFDDGADRVAGRHEALSLSGTTTRLLSIGRRETVRYPAGDSVLRAAYPRESLLVVARLRVQNRRRSTLTLSRGIIVLGIRGAVGPTRVWSVAAPTGPLGRDRPEIRIPARSTRTLAVVWEQRRTGPQLTDPGARIAFSVPDPPGTPKHGPGKHPSQTTRSGVIDLDR